MIWWRRAGRFPQGLNFRADMQIRPYRFHKFNGASGEVHAMTILFQQSHVSSPLRLKDTFLIATLSIFAVTFYMKCGQITIFVKSD